MKSRALRMFGIDFDQSLHEPPRLGMITIAKRLHQIIDHNDRGTVHPHIQLRGRERLTPGAMKQAIQYLAALDVEVNGINNEIDPADRAVYRTLFGSNSTSQAKLRFGAMAIIPSRYGVEDEARKTLEVLDGGNVWLDIMLFDRSESGHSQAVLRLRGSG